jgi:tetratricopeptide (TPR) repeat protein
MRLQQLLNMNVINTTIKNIEIIMKMNKFYILLIAIMTLGGCAKSVKHDVTDERSKSKTSKIDILADQNIDPIAFEHFLSAMMYEEKNDNQKAADLYFLALNYHPESYEIRYSLASVNYKLGKYPLVLDALKNIDPIDEDVLLLKAASNMSMGKSSESIDNYLEVLQLNPDNLTAYINLSGYYRRARDIDSLIWIYENLTRLRPQISSNWREMGVLFAQKGNYQKAKISFQESLAIDNSEKNIISYLSLAEIYLILKDEDSASIYYKQTLDVDPSNNIANRELSLYFVRTGDFETALPYAKLLSDNKPEDFEAGRRLALIYYGLDSLLVSDSVFTGLIKSGDKNFINHYYLGLIATQRKEYQVARDEFEIVTKMEDTLTSSWLDLGATYKHLNDLSNELNTYKEGLKRIKGLESSLKLKLALGSAYERNGDIEQAVEIFKDIIESDPENSKALNYLGYMLADKGERLEYAKGLIERALAIEPENGAFLDSYGWVYYKMGNLKEALKYLQKAAELTSEYIIYDHLGDAYNTLGDNDNAIIWWNKALELSPENELIKAKLKH